MADEPIEGEAQTADEIAAARQAFLSDPPAVLSTDEPVVDDAAAAAALEAEALAELTPPAPAGSEAAAAPAAPAAPAPAPAGTPDPYAAYGGEEAVRTAAQVQQALRTEPGIRALVANGLLALGYDPEQIKASLDGTAVPAEPVVDESDPLFGLEDDDTVDVKTLREIVARTAQQAAEAAVAAQQPHLASVEERILEQQQQTVRTNTDAALINVLGPPPADPAERQTYSTRVDQIVARAAATYDPTQATNPAHFQSIISTAKAALDAEDEARFQTYLATKRQARDNQPVNTGGGAGGEGPLPEPKNLTEAREQARAAGFFG